MSEYYILANPGTDDAFWHANDNFLPSVFETEKAATVIAKDYAPAIVLKAVARATACTIVKVGKIT